jgi:hypothetical protein
MYFLPGFGVSLNQGTTIVRILNLFTKDTNVVDQVLARVSACHNLVMTSQRTLLSGHPICRPYIMFVYRHHHRYWVELPTLPNRDHPSRLAI